MNFRRLDFDRFTLFVGVHRHSPVVHGHAHEDCLSYVLYSGTRELLVDPGLPTYQPEDSGFREADRHNGLTDAKHPLRPRRRFFHGRLLRSEPMVLEERVVDGVVSFTAQNRIFGLTRKISFRPVPGGLDIKEEIERQRGLRAPVFVHVFADMDVSMTPDGALCHKSSGHQLTYGRHRPRLETTERSLEYGDRRPCQRALLDLPPDRRITVSWQLR